jgi:thiamine-monophosphate kinase
VKLSDLGEFGFIERLRGLLPDGRVEVGIGDDAAVVRMRDGSALVATTDALVEGVHFRLDWSTSADVGFKAVSVNVSDLAAMGAEPRWLLVCLCAPTDLDAGIAEGLYGGMVEAGAIYGTEVIGGDTVRSDELVITVTALGELDGEPMRRSSARAGDVLAVSGPLGRAAAGVNLLLSNDPKDVVPEHAMACIDAHRRPVARVREGRRLQDAGIRAAIDISDGLASDAGRLAEASGVAVEIDHELLPVAAEARSVGADRGWDVTQMVLVGGEDLELLVAVPAARAAELDELGLTKVGRVVERGTEVEAAWLVRDGKRQPLGPLGWDHFRRGETARTHPRGTVS